MYSLLDIMEQTAGGDASVWVLWMEPRSVWADPRWAGLRAGVVACRAGPNVWG